MKIKKMEEINVIDYLEEMEGQICVLPEKWLGLRLNICQRILDLLTHMEEISEYFFKRIPPQKI